MATPTNYADAWKLTMRINFNNVGIELTQGKSLGWSETYYLPFGGSLGDLTAAPDLVSARKIVSARAALLGGNCRIVRTTLGRLTQYRDRYPLGTVQDYPLTTFGDLQDPEFGFCSSVDDALLFRFENERVRFTHSVRGIRDAWIDDDRFFGEPSRSSYGPYNSGGTPPLSFDAGALPAALTPPAASGVMGEITFTNTGGVLTVPTGFPTGSGLKIQGLADGVFKGQVVRGWVQPDTSIPQPLTLTITLAGGVITAAAVDSAQGGTTTYPTGTTYQLLPDNDGVSLRWYLNDFDYVRNFGSVIAQYCCFFSTGYVPKAEFNTPTAVARWPAGAKIPVADITEPKTIISNGNGKMRYMVERVAARQTGRMYKDKRARKKVAR